MASKSKENRTIVLPIAEKMYMKFIENPQYAHVQIGKLYKSYPELFPYEMEKGYIHYGTTRVSKKLKMKFRKIKIGEEVYRIRPDFVLPYNRAKTDEVSKGLFLIKFGVPFWAIAYVFGKNAMWWYRLYICLSQFSLVGTTIKGGDKLPKHILSDEHHIRIRGKKAYVATTVGHDCFLGMEVVSNADEEHLTKGYWVFKKEAQHIDADYSPITSNTDGWMATQNALKTLYPKIIIIECFLHAFLKVRDRATKKLNDYFDKAGDKIWNCYRALSKRSLAQQIRRLNEWAQAQVPDSPMKENILKLCKKKNRWMIHFDQPCAHHTSNMLDRIMRIMKKHAYNSQMFHSNIDATTKNFRALAILYNFTPSCPKARDGNLMSPAARINEFVYHDKWLNNLLISASLNGFR